MSTVPRRNPFTVTPVLASVRQRRSAYVQSTGFVLDPDRRMTVSVYFIGSLVPDDVVGLIRHLRAITAQDTA